MAELKIQTVDTEMMDEVDELLKDTGKIPAATATRLILAMTKQNTEAVNQLIEHIREQNGKVAEQQRQINELKDKNIIMWLGKNPKLAFVYFFVFILALDVAVDKLASVDTLGLLFAIGKKIFGL